MVSLPNRAFGRALPGAAPPNPAPATSKRPLLPPPGLAAVAHGLHEDAFVPAENGRLVLCVAKTNAKARRDAFLKDGQFDDSIAGIDRPCFIVGAVLVRWIDGNDGTLGLLP